MLRVVYIALLLLAPASIAQKPVSLSVSLEPPEIPWHRTATYTLRLQTPPGGAVEFPDLKSVEPDLTIRKGDLRISEGEESAYYEQDYILDAIRPGVYYLPATEMTLEGAEVSVPAMALSVRDLTEDEMVLAQEFEDLPLPEVIESSEGLPAWAYAAIAAGVLALVVGLVYLWRRKQAQPAAPPAPPWEVAMHRLRELESRNLPSGGKHETYYVDLSAILRYYIEDRFSIRAPELTTPEFLEAAQGSGALTEEQQDVLEKLLRHCDRVKFARYTPQFEEMDESLDTVKIFVEETTPRMAPDETGQEQAA